MELKIIQTAGAILYPKKIIIETRNLSGPTGGSIYTTDDITILPVDSSLETLGRAISAHLSRSVFDRNISVNYKQVRKNYLKKGKFKSEPDSNRDARYVGISRGSSLLASDPDINAQLSESVSHVASFLSFLPYDNKLSEGRWSSMSRMVNEIFEIDDLNDYSAIGKAIQKAWTKCIFS